jgi:hypothetical protein
MRGKNGFIKDSFVLTINNKDAACNEEEILTEEAVDDDDDVDEEDIIGEGKRLPEEVRT